MMTLDSIDDDDDVCMMVVVLHSPSRCIIRLVHEAQ